MKIPMGVREWCGALFADQEHVGPELTAKRIIQTNKCQHGGAMYRFPARWTRLLPGTLEAKWQVQGGMDWGVNHHQPQLPSQIPSVEMGAEAQEIWKKCKELLKIVAVEIVDPTLDKPVYWQGVQIHQFLSRTFLMPKPNQPGVNRMLVGMKESGLNEILRCDPFKQEGIQEVKEQARPGDYACKLDLENAYYQTVAVPQLRRQMRTKVLNWDSKEVVVLQYKGGSQGLKPIPEKFTKQLRGLQRKFREYGIRIIIKIDDVLILADSTEKCLLHTWTVVRVTTYLGCVWKPSKCQLQPTQRIEFHGAMFCFAAMLCWTPREKCFRAVQTTEELISALTTTATCTEKKLTLRAVARVKGIWMAMIEMVHEVRLLLTELADIQLEMMSSQEFKRASWNMSMEVSKLDQSSLEAAVQALKLLCRPDGTVVTAMPMEADWKWNGRLFGRATILATLWTDACDYQWGLILVVKSVRILEVAYPFSPEEVQNWHITKKETAGMTRGLDIVLKMYPHLSNGTIACKTDATTTKAYLKKAGGRLTHLNKLIWSTVHKLVSRQLLLQVSHVAGLLNISDAPSRQVLGLEEFGVNKLIYGKLAKMWGAPMIDLFAAEWNAKCEVYASKHMWDLQATYVDSMTLVWTELVGRLWINPPVHKKLLLKIVRKLQQEQVLGATLMVPLWKSIWLSEALAMTVTTPILLQANQQLLLPPKAYTLVAELQGQDWSTPPTWTWFVCLNISGGLSRLEASRQRLSATLESCTNRKQMVRMVAHTIAHTGAGFGTTSTRKLAEAASGLSQMWLSAIVPEN